MEDLLIYFQEIFSHGHTVKGDYYLVCNGKLEENQRVKILTFDSFNRALKNYFQDDPNQKSNIIITPLREWITLKIRAFIKDSYRDFDLTIDIKKNSITVEIMHRGYSKLSNTNIAKIISSLGIKQGEKILYLKDFQNVKIYYKQTPRIFGM